MNPRRHALAAFLVSTFLLSGELPLHAAWNDSGIPVAQEGALHSRRYPIITSDGMGGAYFAWVTDDSVNASRTEYINEAVIQRLDASGGRPAPWPAGGLWLTMTPRPQMPAALVGDGVGGAYVIWIDSRNASVSNMDLYISRAVDGAIAPGWAVDGLPICTAPNYQEDVILVPDGSGGVFVIWNETRNAFTTGDGADIYGTRVLPDGTFAPGWPLNGKPVVPPAGSQSLAGAIADGTGGVVIVFVTGPSFGEDSYAVHIDGDGDPVPGWPSEIIPVAIGPGFEAGPVASDGAGGFYMTWADHRITPPPPYPQLLDYLDVYGVHVLADGTRAPGWPLDGKLLCNARDGQHPTFPLADGAGGLLIAWEDWRDPVTRPDIYATRVGGDGTLSPGWIPNGNPLIVSPYAHYFTNVNPLVPQGLVSDGAGGMYVATVNDAATRGTAQHVLADGSIEPGWPAEGLLVPPQPTSGQDYVALASDGHRGAIMTWPERRGSPYTNIYAAHLGPLGPTSTLVSLVAAEAEPGVARLRWHAANAAGMPAVVQRRETEGEWAQIARVASDGAGLIAFEDHDVVAGRGYGYRLAYSEAGGMSYTPETWLEIPARFELALGGMRPNPATRGDLTVAFTLPNGEPAQLELVDVAGRRVLQREVSGLGAGRHVVRLDEGRTLHAGVYWLRLHHGARTLTARGVVLW